MPLISANRSRPGPVRALRRRPVALTSRAWLVYSRVQFLSMCSADAQPLDDRGAGPPGDLPSSPCPPARAGMRSPTGRSAATSPRRSWPASGCRSGSHRSRSPLSAPAPRTPRRRARRPRPERSASSPWLAATSAAQRPSATASASGEAMTSRTAGVLAAPNRERTMPGCAAAAATPAGPQRRASSRVNSTFPSLLVA
jgi:hypothetical protein